ncbi:hypothetical protein P9112_009076 [Eukaryota sp. TZLM1-RC]
MQRPQFLTTPLIISASFALFFGLLLFTDIVFFITGAKLPTTTSTLCSSYEQDREALASDLKLSPDLLPSDLCNLAPSFNNYTYTYQTPLPKFPKFLWWVVDGWSRTHSADTIEDFGIPGNTFLLNVPTLKYSHAIYTSLLTGNPLGNFAGRPITNDNFVYSYVRSGGKVRYHGPEWSLLAIHGANNYKKLFSTIEKVDESHSIKFSHNFPLIFKPLSISNPSTEDFERLPPEKGSPMDKEITDNMSAFLDDLKSKGESLIAHSGIFDHVAHSRNTTFKWEISNTVTRDMKRIEEWIVKNPEYFLVISSDHGVDGGKFAEVLHGYSDNGNSGIYLFWSPLLNSTVLNQGNKCQGILYGCGERWIETVDKSFTWSILMGIDIPYSSIGVGQPLVKNLVYEIRFRLLNLVQNFRVGVDRGLVSGGDRVKVKEFLGKGSEFLSIASQFDTDDVIDQSWSDFNQDLNQFNHDFSSKLMTLRGFPFVNLFLLLISLSILCLILYFSGVKRFIDWGCIFVLNSYFFLAIVLGYSTPEPHIISTAFLTLSSIVLISTFNSHPKVVSLLILNHVLGLVFPILIDSTSDQLDSFAQSFLGRVVLFSFAAGLVLLYLKWQEVFSPRIGKYINSLVVLILILGLFHELSSQSFLSNGFNPKVIPVYLLFFFLFGIMAQKIAFKPRHLGIVLMLVVVFLSIHIPVMRFSILLMMSKVFILIPLYDHMACSLSPEPIGSATPSSLSNSPLGINTADGVSRQFVIVVVVIFTVFLILSDLTTLQSDMVSLSVRPAPGRAGITSDNIYPGFSATCMAFGKFYSTFVISFIFFDFFKTVDTTLPQDSHQGLANGQITRIASTILSLLTIRFILFVFFVLSLLVRLSFGLVVWLYGRNNCFETQFTLTVIMVAVSLTLALLFTVFDLKCGLKGDQLNSEVCE